MGSRFHNCRDLTHMLLQANNTKVVLNGTDRRQALKPLLLGGLLETTKIGTTYVNEIDVG